MFSGLILSASKALSERLDESGKRNPAGFSIGFKMNLTCDAPSLFSMTHGFTFYLQFFREHGVAFHRTNVDKVVAHYSTILSSTLS